MDVQEPPTSTLRDVSELMSDMVTEDMQVESHRLSAIEEDASYEVRTLLLPAVKISPATLGT